ncbi:hypothetical protein B0H66DRAFT_608613 [Apodospora peruviana]|uniref:Uncharacterized protein n=1 Tax=Apodospora peruviana TaxID=516989 RepID=A0AAE0HT10_9PEZI|nr:hypothetical protein B0H66DRAFT_608613 [Apodospora peruviana]
MRHWLSEASKYHHDKIYALCGHVDDLNIRFDYTKPWAEVYTDFARSVLQPYGNLDIFSALTTNKRVSAKLPTWVPDWRVGSYKNNTLIYRHSVSCPQFSDDGRRVRVRGFILDTIIAASDIRPAKFTALQIVRRLIHWRDHIAQYCKTNKAYYRHTGQPVIDVFYDTITMNNVRGFLQDPPTDYSTFDKNLDVLKTRSTCLKDITDSGRNATWQAFVRSTDASPWKGR